MLKRCYTVNIENEKRQNCQHDYFTSKYKTSMDSGRREPISINITSQVNPAGNHISATLSKKESFLLAVGLKRRSQERIVMERRETRPLIGSLCFLLGRRFKSLSAGITITNLRRHPHAALKISHPDINRAPLHHYPLSAEPKRRR